MAGNARTLNEMNATLVNYTKIIRGIVRTLKGMNTQRVASIETQESYATVSTEFTTMLADLETLKDNAGDGLKAFTFEYADQIRIQPFIHVSGATGITNWQLDVTDGTRAHIYARTEPTLAAPATPVAATTGTPMSMFLDDDYIEIVGSIDNDGVYRVAASGVPGKVSAYELVLTGILPGTDTIVTTSPYNDNTMTLIRRGQ